MTFLGKVLTSIVFILSVVFFFLSAMTNANHINYRKLVEDKSTGFKVLLAKEQAKTKELTEQNERLKDEQAIERLGRRLTVANLESAVALKDADLKDIAKKLAEEQAKVTLMAANELASKQELAARQAENNELRKQLVDARMDRDAQYQKFTNTYDSLLRQQGEKQSLDKQVKEMARDLTSAVAQLNILGIGPKTKLDGPPAVNGVVTAISNELVEVSIGLDDGIRTGDELDVYRSGAYIGRIKITRSAADQAIGRIMPEFAKGFIVVGDRVDSKLNEIYVKRPQ